MQISMVGAAVLLALSHAHEEWDSEGMGSGSEHSSSHSMDQHMGHTAESTADQKMAHHSMGSMKDDSKSHNITASPASVHGGHSHGKPILEMLNMLEPQQKAYWLAYDPTTYFNAKSGSKPLLYLHAALQFLSLAVLLPATSLLAFQQSSQWLYIPLQTAVVLMISGSTFVASLYSLSLPESLYPGNCYGKVLMIFLTAVVVHWIAIVSRSITRGYGTALDGAEYHLTNLERPSQDSGNDCEADSINSQDFDIEDLTPSHQENYNRVPRIAQKLAHSSFGVLFEKFQSCSQLLVWLMTVPLVLFGFTTLMIGVFVGTRMGMGHNVFGLLAHAIKGGVFFVLGFVELSRYFGAFASKGMAWNTINLSFLKSTTTTRKWYQVWPENPTMEFLQSFLIFFYGSTNIFLEHLGNTDGKWSHKDLQHASIAFMFLGCGLCGMVLESRSVSRALARAFGYEADNSLVRSWSINPFPAFTIFWTGALMSQHQQETPLATAIHTQWGILLSAAAVIRIFTLVLLETKTNVSRPDLPQRPFTELLCSFCLIAGGMIFVLSNRESVEAMIFMGLNKMFTLIVGVGITSLLMVGAAFALAFKGLAAR